jgi:hypothetical protein
MLALAYAAVHPAATGPLVLVGCGTFDLAARERMRAILDARIDDALRRRFEHLPEEFPNPQQRWRRTQPLQLAPAQPPTTTVPPSRHRGRRRSN